MKEYRPLGIDPSTLSPDARKLVRQANMLRREQGEDLHTDHFVAAAVVLGFGDENFPKGIKLEEIRKRMLSIDDEMSRVELLSVRRIFNSALLTHRDGSQITPRDIMNGIRREVHSRGASLIVNTQYPLI